MDEEGKKRREERGRQAGECTNQLSLGNFITLEFCFKNSEHFLMVRHWKGPQYGHMLNFI